MFVFFCKSIPISFGFYIALIDRWLGGVGAFSSILLFSRRRRHHQPPRRFRRRTRAELGDATIFHNDTANESACTLPSLFPSSSSRGRRHHGRTATAPRAWTTTTIHRPTPHGGTGDRWRWAAEAPPPRTTEHSCARLALPSRRLLRQQRSGLWAAAPPAKRAARSRPSAAAGVSSYRHDQMMMMMKKTMMASAMQRYTAVRPI